MAGTFVTGIAILNSEQILLTKRENFEIWCVFGGMAKPGESLGETAVRELHAVLTTRELP